MSLNFDHVFTDLDGSALQESGEDLTMRMVCVNALTHAAGGDGDEKVKRWQLAKRLFPGGTQSITPEEAVLLKQLIGARFPPVIVGNAFELLNG